MSYILEALKRAEQERVRTAAPALHAVMMEPLRQSGRPIGRYLTAGILLSAIGIGGWLHTRQSEKGEVVAPAPVSVAARTVRPAPPAGQSLASAATVAESKTAPIRAGEPAGTQVAATAGAPSRASPRPQAQAVAVSASDIVEFSDLPRAVQRALPKLAISGYVNYAGEPSGRMVALGDQLVREGEEVRAGLKLEQIRPDGAVFSYKGYRFHLAR